MATKAKSTKKRGTRKHGARKHGARQHGARQHGARKWSARVTQTSDALTLDRGVFTRGDPKAIARSLKRSADRSKRRKTTPFQSAMSMLNFYINRAGKDLPARQRQRLNRAKDELRALYGRDPKKRASKRKTARKKRAG